jgi:sporulation protein YlmC with PRC-barrel domain
MVRHKRIRELMYGCLVLMLAGIAMAAQQETETAKRTSADLDEIRKVSTLLDTDVMNKSNEKIAGIEDLVFAPEGTIHYAILSQGGVAGVGATYYAVPWDLFMVKHANGKWAVNLDTTKEILGKAPRFEDTSYKDLMKPEWVAKVHSYFRPNPDRETRSPGAVSMVLRASKLNDAKLKNTQNQDVGELVELLLDRNYRAVFAIVGRGGVLGIGESYIPVPWSKLRLMYNKETTVITAMIDATKAQLEQAPLVKEDSYATMLAPGFAGQVDRYFGSTRTPAP